MGQCRLFLETIVIDLSRVVIELIRIFVLGGKHVPHLLIDCIADFLPEVIVLSLDRCYLLPHSRQIKVLIDYRVKLLFLVLELLLLRHEHRIDRVHLCDSSFKRFLVLNQLLYILSYLLPG